MKKNKRFSNPRATKKRGLIVQKSLIFISMAVKYEIYHIEKCKLHYQLSRSHREWFRALEYHRKKGTSLPTHICAHIKASIRNVTNQERERCKTRVSNANDVPLRPFTYFY